MTGAEEKVKNIYLKKKTIKGKKGDLTHGKQQELSVH